MAAMAWDSSAMDAMLMVLQGRNDALLVGDYHSYAKQCARKTLALRKRLGLSTPKHAAYKKQHITNQHYTDSPEVVIQLLLLTAERAWSKAMHTKSLQSEDAVITGSVRLRIIAKLGTAAHYASQLLRLLQDKSASPATTHQILSATAYHASLVGSVDFEKQAEGQKTKTVVADKSRWTSTLKSYSTVRVILEAIYSGGSNQAVSEYITNTVDPTIKYVAYQARLSRTIAVPTLALRYFPTADTALVSAVKSINQTAFDEPSALRKEPSEAHDSSAASNSTQAPTHISWRGMEAEIVDATIGQALAQVKDAELQLSQYLKSHPNATQADKATAYDSILAASQEAADAARHATEELEREGVDEGDARMQDLRISNLAINYDLVSWRVGRNRVLIGADDGRSPPESHGAGKKRTKHANSLSKRVARLRERIVLYDASIQSIESIKTIRGAVRDSSFVAELDAKKAYFEALRCVNIASSHAMHNQHVNTLALLSHSRDLVATAQSSLSQLRAPNNAPSSLDIHSEDVNALSAQIDKSLLYHHALAEMDKMHAEAQSAHAKLSQPPLIQRLHDYPVPGTAIDTSNLVSWPLKREPVPVKPIFLDVAWNYIDYPGRTKEVEVVDTDVAMQGTDGAKPETAKPKEKKGWFGFGR